MQSLPHSAMNDGAHGAPRPETAVARSVALRLGSADLRQASIELRQRGRFLRRRVRHQFSRSNDLLTTSLFQRGSKRSSVSE